MSPLSTAVAAVICLPALVLAYRRSSWMVEYTIAVVAINRGVRRVVDYYNGYFDRTSPVILAALVVCLLAVLVTLNDLQSGRRLGRVGKRAVGWYFSALAIAFAVGVVRNGPPALIELAEYLGPLGMLGFGIQYGGSDKVLRRWARSAAWIGVAVAAYGLYQFYTIPPWDAFWVRAVDFEGYLGRLEPTKMTLFSTLAERGPAASFLASATILLLLRRGILGSLRWPAAALTGYAMTLAYSRTAVVQVGVAAAALPFVGGAKSSRRLIPIVLAAVIVSQAITAFSPVGDRLSSRYATLGNLAEDNSANARIYLFFRALPVIATNPLGLGFGAQGAATRVSGAQTDAVIDSTGYLNVFQLFGWIGGAMIFRLLWQCWRSSQYVLQREPTDEDAAFFRAWFVSGLVALISGLWFVDAMYFWCLAGAMFGRHDQLALQKTTVSEPLPGASWDPRPIPTPTANR